MIFIVTKIFIISLRGASVARVVLAVLARNSLHEQCTCDPCLPISPLPLSYCISNKFPYHHCHVYAVEEGNMLNLQSMPKITPCLIVLQRKPIVCPWEAPKSQGLLADSLK